jgi:hypothetical protein
MRPLDRDGAIALMRRLYHCDLKLRAEPITSAAGTPRVPHPFPPDGFQAYLTVLHATTAPTDDEH